MQYSIKGIGERISAARKAAGITQEELAAKLTITPQAISKWERGTGLPDISVLPELAEALGISVGELFGEKADQSTPNIFNGLPLVATSNGIGCYSDKAVISADETCVKFTDGSVADFETQTVINKGAGDVRLVEFDNSFVPSKSQPTIFETELDYFENLELTLSNCCNLEIIGEEESRRGIFASGSPQFISNIDSSLRDNTLYLNVRSAEGKHGKENNKLTIYTGLTYGNSIKIAANGSGNVSFGIPFREADITVSGEADVFANNIDAISVTINGCGNVHFGNAVTLNARINGAGDLTFDCVGGSASVTVSGAGDVRGDFVNSLTFRVIGAGDISIREVSHLLSINVNGKGDVKCGGEVDDMWICVGGVGNIDLKQLVAKNAKIDLGGVADVTIGNIIGQSTERVSKESSLSVLKRG